MKLHFLRLASKVAILLGLLMPTVSNAQDPAVQAAEQGSTLPIVLVSILIFVGLTALLLRLWSGVINAWLKHSLEEGALKKKHYIASERVIIGTIIGTGFLILLSLNTLKDILPSITNGVFTLLLTAFIVLSAGLVYLQHKWKPSREYIFSALIGSCSALMLIAFQQTIFQSGAVNDPYFMSLAVVCVLLVWRMLFGPWDSHIKATVLGTFILCVAGFMLMTGTSEERMARMLAAVVAIIPAVIWCLFFLRYHKQNWSFVLLMFFAGMLSTAPILFYDSLVRRGAEMQFFYFKIVPENFNRTSSLFVSGNLIGVNGIRTTLLVSLLSFMLVGFIEEVSKFWVMKRSGKRFFSSIDDAMQLSIIVAIGFAFAENVLNPTYFVSFIREFLMAQQPDWGGFMGNVLGRAILTNMVHIVSTGVMGYFFGLALFAGPYIKEKHKQGKVFLVADGLHALLGFPEKEVFRRQMFLIGLFIATVLHGLFNFLVTFPDLLPGNPRSLGALFGAASDSALNAVPLLMIPSLFYIVGGFWLLTELFYRKESMKEWGRVVTADTLVKE